ncbi:MAG: class I SAM-dependent methyltransferase [Proteobacteria bacterium]|jgi:ubiquinone/menaquinone biosynthesis C-methylase UbiE|nr:class I SAM-dependent methyltransferase [Pseudomonadota bacterium]
MGLYDHYILPPLLNAAMGAKPIRYQRKKVVPRAEGRVLEIGFGAGHNLPFYDASKVSHLWALEPSPEMRERAAERVSQSSIPLEFLDLPSEQIPLGNEEADTILITYTLCTIPDVMKALGEMRRVLKSNGKMIFCEHGEAPDEDVRKWQRRLTPAWKFIGGGCHVGRQIPKLIQDSGFRITGMETMYLPGTPRFAGFNYWGDAVKA